MKLVTNQQRRYPRSSFSHPAEAKLMVDGREYATRVVDYSLEGFGIRVEESAAKRIEREKVRDVELYLDEDRFAAKIKHQRQEDGRVLLGLNIPAEQSRDISFTTDDPGWDLIDDPETLKNLFSDLAYKGPEAPIEIRQLRGEAVLSAKALKENILQCELISQKRGSIEKGRASVRFEIFQTCHALDAKISSVDGGVIEIELPKQVARLLRRETVRVRNNVEGKQLKVAVTSHLLGEPTGELELYDFSEHGVSLIDPDGWLSAPVGFRMESIAITTPDGTRIVGHGSLRGFHWLPERGTYAIGLQFETDSYEDRTKWHNLILEARYPGLRFQYHPEDHKEIWNLFERSGYVGHLDSKTGSDQVHEYRESTKDTWKFLNESGSRYSRRLTHTRESSVVSHLQMDRYYGPTWCVHHLAIDKKISKVLAKDLYSAVTDILSSEEAKYLISYHRPDLAWNQRNYYDFIKKYPFPDHHDIQLFHLYDAKVDQVPKVDSPGATIRVANEFDLRRIQRFFELTTSKMVCEALSVSRIDPLLEGLAYDLKEHKLDRGREFLVLVEGNSLVAFAQIEWGTPGVNIFRLFDAVFLHIVDAKQANKLGLLLDVALCRLKDRGRERALLFVKDGDPVPKGLSSLHYLCDEVRWIANCVATRRYQAYSQLLFGHLLVRRSGIRGS